MNILKRKKNHNNGFSLIEVLAIIVLLSIIAIISTPIVFDSIDEMKAETFRINVRNIFPEVKKVIIDDVEDGTVSSLVLSPNKFDGGVWEYDEDSDTIILKNVRIDDMYVCYLTDKIKNTSFEISKNCDGHEALIEVTDKNPGNLEGTGTEEDPFTINSIEDLVAFGINVDNGNDYKNQYIKLGLSLDFNYKYSYADYKTDMFGDINNDGNISELKTELTTEMGFNPIGEIIDRTLANDKFFSGTFLGNNKEIRGLYINNRDKSYNGLFSTIDGATITDLTLENANIVTDGTTGILAGVAYYNESSTFSYLSNIHTQGSIEAKNGLVGGIIGCGYGTIIDSSSDITININETASNIGGLAGEIADGYIANNQTNGIIEKKYTNDTYSRTGGLIGRFASASGIVTNNNSNVTIISNSGTYVGGLIGYSQALVENSYATGEVTSKNKGRVGGLIGYTTMTIENSWASGNVNFEPDLFDDNTLSIGGLVGFTSNNVIDSYATGVVKVNYGKYVGGLIGYSTGFIENSYATGEVQVLGENQETCQSGGLVGYLYNISSFVRNSHATGNVTCASGRNIGGLVGVTNSSIESSYATGNVETYIEGSGNVNAGGLVGYTENEVINSYAEGKVTSLSGKNTGGLVGYTISSIENSYATGKVTGKYGGRVGGLVGNTTMIVQNSWASGDVNFEPDFYDENAISSVGGLVGYTTNNVIDSHATGIVKANYGYNIGGLIGYSSNLIENSYAIGHVQVLGENQSTCRAGGLVGYFNNSSSFIRNSHATGNVTCASGKNVGGLVGTTYGVVENSYATGDVESYMDSSSNVNVGGLAGYTENEVIDSYAEGKITSLSGKNTGGLVGYTISSIENSYATGKVTGKSGGRIGGLVGYTTMIVQNSWAIGNVNFEQNFYDSNTVLSIGGLVGYTTNNVIDSHATGIVKANYGYNVGGLIGYSTGSIENSYATGNIQILGENQSVCRAGGLAGYINNSASSIRNSHAIGNVTCASGKNVGGLVGITYGAVENSYSSGMVRLEKGYTYGTIVDFEQDLEGAYILVGDYVGGLIGYSSNLIENSYATGEVVSPSGVMVGGLVGAFVNNSIIDSYATGTVTGRTMVGGIGGWIGVTIDYTLPNVVINSHATGSVTSSESCTGGLFGAAKNTRVTNSYASGNVTSMAVSTYELCDYVGGLFGYYNNEILINNEPIYARNVYYTGNVSGIRNVGGLMGCIAVGKNSIKVENAYAVANVSASESAAGGITPNTHIIENMPSYDKVTISNVLFAGSVSSPSFTYPMIDAQSNLYLTTSGLYCSSTLAISNPTNSYGTIVNINSLKTSSWYTNTLKLNNNWQFQNNYYPKLYRVNGSGIPTTELLNHQTNRLVQ